MKVILRKNHDKLGKIGEIVEVKSGFATNFLFPRKIAYIATAGNILALEQEKKSATKREAAELAKAQSFANDLEKISVTITVKVGEDERLFGSVTSQMIADAIKEKGFEIDKRKIELEDSIKALGIYEIKIKIHPEVLATIKTWVVKE
jgi:large subunit ribosomal protein L9